MKEIRLTWAAWHGDLPLTIGFPESWDVTIVENTPQPVLDHAAILAKISRPQNSLPLTELAKGKKTAAILIDDMTRPTPTDMLLPLIIKALEDGGIKRSGITIVIAGAAHKGMEEDDVIKKTGLEPTINPDVRIHDCDQNLVYLGRSLRGTPVYVNQTVMACELKIGVGMILPHPIAGFSGGSKIAVPGVCGIETIRHIHDYAQCYQPNYHHGPGSRLGNADNDFRQEIEAICDMIGMDFVVNVVLGPKRGILDLFAGERKEVFRQGVRSVMAHYRVKPVQADVTVANTYPFDTEMHYMLRGFWPLNIYNHRQTRVAIGFCKGGKGQLDAKQKKGSLPLRLMKRMRTFKPEHLPNDIKVGMNIIKKKMHQKKLDYLIFSPNIKNEELRAVWPKSRSYAGWEELVAEIRRRHPQNNVTVAVYPYAPLQFP
jgi:nickel-dependent lactate racemase